jgi:hypothetical protein
LPSFRLKPESMTPPDPGFAPPRSWLPEQVRDHA